MLTAFAILTYTGLLDWSSKGRERFGADRRSGEGSRERFSETPTHAERERDREPWSALRIVWTVMYGVLVLLLGGLAVYLSWTSNSLIRRGTLAKVIFAIFAFLCNGWYLISHYLHKVDMIRYILKTSGTPSVAPSGASETSVMPSDTSSSSPELPPELPPDLPRQPSAATPAAP